MNSDGVKLVNTTEKEAIDKLVVEYKKVHGAPPVKMSQEDYKKRVNEDILYVVVMNSVSRWISDSITNEDLRAIWDAGTFSQKEEFIASQMFPE